MAKAQRNPAFVPPGAGAWLRWFNETREYLVVGEQSLGRAAIARQTLSPGATTMPCIRHACQSGFYLLDGEFSVVTGNRVLALTTGAFINIRPGTPWKLQNSAQTPARFLTIAAPAGIDELEFRTGLPLADPGDQPPEFIPEAEPLPIAIALEYGVHLDLLPTAFDIEPCLRLSLPGEGHAYTLAGDIYRPLANSHDTEGRYAALHVRIAPEHTLPWQSHVREDLFLEILSGTLTIEANGQTTSIETGVFWHLPSGAPFQIHNKSAVPAEILLVAAPAGLEHLIELTAASWQDPKQFPPPNSLPTAVKLAAHANDFGIELHGPL